MRYSRQIMLAGFDIEKQEKLLNSRALVIGLGGLGCAASQYLVASGAGHITLVDDDKVDRSNLQRQVLHIENSIGEPKVLSAKNRLTAINSETQINTVAQRLDDQALSKLIKEHDIVLDCTDNLHTRNQLNGLCYRDQTTLVSGAAIRMEGQVFVVKPNEKTACYACLSQFFAEQDLSCVENGVMSPIVGVVGAMQALEAIKCLTDFGTSSTNKLLLFDGMTSDWQSFSVSKDQNCTVCAT
jgi:adenylyltransferase/sulfurtransferase